MKRHLQIKTISLITVLLLIGIGLIPSISGIDNSNINQKNVVILNQSDGFAQ